MKRVWIKSLKNAVRNGEVIIAAKNASVLDGSVSDKAQLEIKNEICDLLYHLTVLDGE